MKYKLPKITIVILVGLQGIAAAQNPANTTAASGQDLVSKAADNLARESSLEARIRQQVSMFGQYLVGTGIYQQLIIEEREMFRFELKIQVAGKLTSLQQISDGRRLLIGRNRDGERTLGYVNLQRVRESISKAQPENAPGFDRLAVGGLQQLLSGLNNNFKFDSPQATEIGKLPAWKVTGTWKPDVLALMLPDAAPGAARLEDLPDHLPHYIALTLGRDEPLPLFPYRIEYLRNSEPATAENPEASRVTLVTMELFEVRRRSDLQPANFDYRLKDQDFEDETDLFLQKLGIKLNDDDQS